ncbi:MAG: ATP-binding cassette domain-containing protein [Clostridiales bacterium]|jgi:oligopeptide/dipeptide ABC transporter ATP-binding protein|nr:ATP-binding cassette domain-containing protein [Clostridiales bacterium]
MSAQNNTREPILKVEHLTKHFIIKGKGNLHAVDDVSFEIMPNETLGLVGESGCGKSTVGNVLMRFFPETAGSVFYKGKDWLKMSGFKKKELRRDIQMIFQDPYSSLNPRKTIWSILSEPFVIHRLCKKSEIDTKVRELMDTVGLETYIQELFPHELDGGKRQMVGIARALALNPKFIVCDEPVSSLDVSVQATIINLLVKLQKEMELSYLFISHDLSVVRHISDRIVVMYLGQIVETAEKNELFLNTLHPYSIALLSAVPTTSFEAEKTRIVLEGDVPSPLNPNPDCCRFAPRCWMAQEKCFNESPMLDDVGAEHCVACHYWRQSKQRAKV